MVWLFVPYAYSYYTTIAVHKQHKYIAIANTVLLFVLDHELYPDSNKFIIARWTIQIWPAPKVTSERIIGNFKLMYACLTINS